MSVTEKANTEITCTTMIADQRDTLDRSAIKARAELGAHPMNFSSGFLV